MTVTLKRQALLLSYFTVGYNVVECLLALLAGFLSGSIALVGFGLDSLLECLSGAVMIWRFYPHRDLSEAEEARLERRAVKIIGYIFFALAAYIFMNQSRNWSWRKSPSPVCWASASPWLPAWSCRCYISSNYAPVNFWGAPA